MDKNGVKQFGYNKKSINYMTNNFVLDEFFKTDQAIGVILITPKQIAISYGSIKDGLIHDNMIEEMLNILKTNNPIIAIRCYTYSNRHGGCIPFVIGNRKITQDMYNIVDKINEKVTDISSHIMTDTAKELVEFENLKINNSNMKNEKIIGIKLEDFIKTLYEKNIEEKKISELSEHMLELVDLTKEKFSYIKGKVIKNKRTQEKSKDTEKKDEEKKIRKYKIENSRNQIEKKAIEQSKKTEEKEIEDSQIDNS